MSPEALKFLAELALLMEKYGVELKELPNSQLNSCWYTFTNASGIDLWVCGDLVELLSGIRKKRSEKYG